MRVSVAVFPHADEEGSADPNSPRNGWQESLAQLTKFASDMDINKATKS